MWTDDMHASEVVTNQRRPFRQGQQRAEQLHAALARRTPPAPRSIPHRHRVVRGVRQLHEVIAACGFHSIKAVRGRGRECRSARRTRIAGNQCTVSQPFVEAGAISYKPARRIPAFWCWDPPRDGFKHIASCCLRNTATGTYSIFHAMWRPSAATCRCCLRPA